MDIRPVRPSRSMRCSASSEPRPSACSAIAAAAVYAPCSIRHSVRSIHSRPPTSAPETGVSNTDQVIERSLIAQLAADALDGALIERPSAADERRRLLRRAARRRGVDCPFDLLQRPHVIPHAASNLVHVSIDRGRTAGARRRCPVRYSSASCVGHVRRYVPPTNVDHSSRVRFRLATRQITSRSDAGRRSHTNASPSADDASTRPRSVQTRPETEPVWRRSESTIATWVEVFHRRTVPVRAARSEHDTVRVERDRLDRTRVADEGAAQLLTARNIDDGDVAGVVADREHRSIVVERETPNRFGGNVDRTDLSGARVDQDDAGSLVGSCEPGVIGAERDHEPTRWHVDGRASCRWIERIVQGRDPSTLVGNVEPA